MANNKKKHAKSPAAAPTTSSSTSRGGAGAQSGTAAGAGRGGGSGGRQRLPPGIEHAQIFARNGRMFPGQAPRAAADRTEAEILRDFKQENEGRAFTPEDYAMIQLVQTNRTPRRDLTKVRARYKPLGSFVAVMTPRMDSAAACGMLELLTLCRPDNVDEFYEALRCFGLTDIVYPWLAGTDAELSMWAARVLHPVMTLPCGIQYFFEDVNVTTKCFEGLQKLDHLGAHVAMATLMREVVKIRKESAYVGLNAPDLLAQGGFAGCASFLAVMQLIKKRTTVVVPLLEAVAYYLEHEGTPKDLSKTIQCIIGIHEATVDVEIMKERRCVLQENAVVGPWLSCLGQCALYGSDAVQDQVRQVDFHAPCVAFLREHGGDSTRADMARGCLYMLSGWYHMLDPRRVEREVEIDGVMAYLPTVLSAHVRNADVCRAALCLIGVIGSATFGAGSSELLRKMRVAGLVERTAQCMVHSQRYQGLQFDACGALNLMMGETPTPTAAMREALVPAFLCILDYHPLLYIFALDALLTLFGGDMIGRALPPYSTVSKFYPFVKIQNMLERFLPEEPLPLVIVAIRVLSLLTMMSGAQDAIVDNDYGLIKQMLRCMTTFPANGDIAQAVCAVIAMFLPTVRGNPAYRSRPESIQVLADLRRIGAVEAMRAALNSVWREVLVTPILLHAIGQLVQDREGARYFYQTEGLRQLVDVATHHRTNASVVAPALKIMMELSDRTASEQALVGEKELLNIALDALRRFEDSDVIRDALSVMTNCTRTTLGRNVVRTNKDINCLVTIHNLLNRRGAPNFDTLNITANALGLLAGLLFKDAGDTQQEAYVTRAVEAGLVTDVVRVMADYAESSEAFHIFGCACVKYLAGNVNGCRQLRDSTVIRTIQNGLDRFGVHFKSFEAAVEALRPLFEDAAAAQFDANPRLLRSFLTAMNHHMARFELMMSAMMLISSFVTEPARLPRARECGLLQTMVNYHNAHRPTVIDSDLRRSRDPKAPLFVLALGLIAKMKEDGVSLRDHFARLGLPEEVVGANEIVVGRKKNGENITLTLG